MAGRAARLAWRALVAGSALRGLRRRRPDDGERRALPPPADDRLAGGLVLVLLAGASLGFIGFALAYIFGWGTQILGTALASALALLSAAAIAAGKLIVPQQEEVEEVGEHRHDRDRDEAALVVHEAGAGITRRRLLYAAAAGTGCVAAGSLLLPAASLGPVLETERLIETPWRPGRRLVDVNRAPVLAEEIEVGSFVTAFAENTDHSDLDASLIVVRVLEDELSLPPERAGWAPEGLLAYSKICTHAACAVALFDYPSFRETQPRPRLVCPCHYSAFDAAGGGDVIAGPAGRPLPQLPLEILDDGTLAAAGGLSAPPGPSWSRVRP